MTRVEQRLRRELGAQPTINPDPAVLAQIKLRAEHSETEHVSQGSTRSRVALSFSLAASMVALAFVGLLTIQVRASSSAASIPDQYLGGKSVSIVVFLLIAAGLLMGALIAAATMHRRTLTTATRSGRLTTIAVVAVTAILSLAPFSFIVRGLMESSESMVQVNHLRFTPSGDLIAAVPARSDTLMLWDVDSKELVQRIDTNHLEIFDLAFSPDGETVATSGLDGTIRFWETSTGDQRYQELLVHEHITARIRFGEDGALVVPDQSAIRFVDPVTQDEVREAIELPDHDFALDMTADGSYLLGQYQESDELGEGLRVWDLEQQIEVFSVRQPSGTWPVRASLSPDANIAVGEFPDHAPEVEQVDVVMWNVETGQPMSLPFDHVFVVLAVHNDELIAVTDEGLVYLQNLSTDEPITTTLLDPALAGASPSRPVATNAAFNHDASLLAVAQPDGMIQLWDLNGQTPVGDPLTLSPESDG